VKEEPMDEGEKLLRLINRLRIEIEKCSKK